VDKVRAAAGDALIIRGGGQVEQPVAGHDAFLGLSLRELCREMLQRAGHRVPSQPQAMILRALSSSDLPNIMANVANKFLLDAYQTAPETWRAWCDTGTLNDFKQATLLRATELSDLQQIPEGGEYTLLQIGEGKENVQLAKYGGRFAITWETIINDDLGVLTEVPAKLGRAAARLVGDVAYAVLTANAAMGDGVALFHTATHGNLASTGAAPGTDSLGDAETAIATQTDAKGAQLNIPAEYFLGPRALKPTAEQFFGTLYLGAEYLKNVYADPYFTRVYDARLDADSASAWYLAGPKGYTVKVFFLSGEPNPFLARREGFDVDGIEIKVRQVVAAKALDWKALYKNPGA
jgi:hypothetical protein